MGVAELKDVGPQNQSIAPAQSLDPSVIIPPPPQFVSDRNRLLSSPRCGTVFSSSASTMSPFAAAARALGHASSSSTEDPLYSDPSQIVNVSYGTMFNCLPCGKGSVDSQHLSRCANACAHKKDTRALLGRWQLACRQSREQGTPMPSPFRPPNPVDYVTKVQKAGQGMIPPTLIRAYPGDQAFGAYETLRASVGPSGDFFPQEPPRMDGVSALAPFRIPTGQLVTPYAPGHAHPFPLLQHQYQFQTQAQAQAPPPIQARTQYQLPDYQFPDYTNAAQLAPPPYGVYGTPGFSAPQMTPGPRSAYPPNAMHQPQYHAVPQRAWVSTVPSGGSGSAQESVQESVQGTVSSGGSQVSVTPPTATNQARPKAKAPKKKSTPARKAKGSKKAPANSTRSKTKRSKK
jgi:hypothetical protein